MKRCALLLALVAGLVVSLASAPVWAQAKAPAAKADPKQADAKQDPKKPDAKKDDKKDDKKKDPKAELKAKVDEAKAAANEARKAVDEAKAAVAEAANQVSTADATITSTQAKLRRDFEDSAELAAATKALKEAQDGLETAKAPVMEKLLAQPEYQKAVAGRDDLRINLKELQEAEKPDQKAIKAMADKVMAADQVVGKMEKDAFENDAKVKEGREKVEAAQAKLLALKNQFEQSLRQNAEIVAARKALEEARAKQAQAQRQAAAASGKVAPLDMQARMIEGQYNLYVAKEDAKKKREQELAARKEAYKRK